MDYEDMRKLDGIQKTTLSYVTLKYAVMLEL